jgi:hypothetical protein
VAAWLGSVDAAAPVALTTVATSPTVQHVVTAVVAGLAVIGAGAVVVNESGPAPRTAPPPR